MITIDPVPFDLLTADGSRSLTVVPPSAHSGVGPVSVRLISSEYRIGQVRRSSRGCGVTVNMILGRNFI